jgi:hypothetical protein
MIDLETRKEVKSLKLLIEFLVTESKKKVISYEYCITINE